PSSLLLGVTSYLTTDIGSAPFLWVLPLAAYLMSFILAFARSSWMSHPILLRAQAFFLVGIAATVFLQVTEPDEFLLPMHLIGFFITALVCHGRLAQDRPSAQHLTDYFLWLSLGGVLGGVFNALFAPSVFKHVIEYPLVIAVAGLIRPPDRAQDMSTRMRQFDWWLPPAVFAFLVLITVALKQVAILPPANDRLLICGLAAVFLLGVALRPVRFGIGLVLLTLVSLWYPSPIGKVLYTGRSFFGSYRAATDVEGKHNVLFQGTTVHGTQSIDRQTKLTPLSYYHRSSPAGQVFLANAAIHGSRKIAVVGLGTGALACYGTAKQTFTFYEIDPLVEKIARDDRLFTFLRDCPPRIEVVIGDARLSLARAANQSYDLFVMDAFSSDVIPVHLLTRQAVELYLQKTAPNGVLLFHVSNRYMDLAPVFDRLAAELNLAAFIQNDFNINANERREGKSPSRWILMARDRQVAAAYLADGRWRQLHGQLGGDLWTDDFSDLLKVIYWR
ncbi:MAG: spermidine synthase, partial [Candidatus Binatia bacterium]